MTYFKKTLSLLLSVCLISSAFAISALASEDRTKITDIGLGFNSSIVAGESDGDVEVTIRSSSANYYLDYIDITNMPGNNWSSGDIPQITIYLIANDDYYFYGINKSACSFSGDSATYVSSSIKDNKSTLVLKVKLSKLETSSDDLQVENLSWDDDNAKGEWDEVDAARKYQVRLYRGSSIVGSTESTTKTSFDFSDSITRTGTYVFKVRAYDGSVYGEWEESDDWYVDSDTLDDIKGSTSSSSSSSSSGPNYGSSSSGPNSVSSAKGAWLRDNVGWWYCNADKTYTVNNWQYIDNIWYFFNEYGYMKTGWILWKNIWYYCDTTSGAMYANRYTPDGYYVDSTGAWVR